MMGAAGAAAAAAGGSQAERAAVAYAISRDVLLVAPAGDNGGGGNAVNYPAAYPGVIAVGATARDGELAPFTNTGSYVALTAPGAAGPAVAIDPGATAGPPVGLTVAAPDGGYQTLASTDMAAALTAGVAALIRGRYPWLTAAEVTQAIEDGATAPRFRPGRLDRDELGADRPGGATARSTPGTRSPGPPRSRPLTRGRRRRRRRRPRPPSRPSPPGADAPGRGRQARQPRPGAPLGPARPAHRRLRAHRGPDLRAGRDLGSPPEAVRAGRRGRPRRPRPRPRPSLARPAAGRARPSSGRPTPAWPRTPPRAAIGAGSAWVSANPSARPSPGRADDGPLPPWEQSPSLFASAPVPKAPPPWPLSSTGPMYVWNPAATTGPLRPVEEEDQEP